MLRDSFRHFVAGTNIDVRPASAPAAQTTDNDVATLKAQLAEQQKQIDALKSAIEEQKKTDRKGRAARRAAQPGQDTFALPRNKALGRCSKHHADHSADCARQWRRQLNRGQKTAEAVTPARAVQTPTRCRLICGSAAFASPRSGSWTRRSCGETRTPLRVSEAISAASPTTTWSTESFPKLASALRTARIGFRIDGNWKGTHFIGYNEFDFLGTSGALNPEHHQWRFRPAPSSVLGGREERRLGVSGRTKLEHADPEPRGNLPAAGRPVLLASHGRELHGGLDLDPPAGLARALPLRR